MLNTKFIFELLISFCKKSIIACCKVIEEEVLVDASTIVLVCNPKLALCINACEAVILLNQYWTFIYWLNKLLNLLAIWELIVGVLDFPILLELVVSNPLKVNVEPSLLVKLMPSYWINTLFITPFSASVKEIYEGKIIVIPAKIWDTL